MTKLEVLELVNKCWDIKLEDELAISEVRAIMQTELIPKISEGDTKALLKFTLLGMVLDGN